MDVFPHRALGDSVGPMDIHIAGIRTLEFFETIGEGDKASGFEYVNG